MIYADLSFEKSSNMITDFICLNRWSENRPAGIAAKNPIGTEKAADGKESCKTNKNKHRNRH